MQACQPLLVRLSSWSVLLSEGQIAVIGCQFAEASGGIAEHGNLVLQVCEMVRGRSGSGGLCCALAFAELMAFYNDVGGVVLHAVLLIATSLDSTFHSDLGSLAQVTGCEFSTSVPGNATDEVRFLLTFLLSRTVNRQFVSGNRSASLSVSDFGVSN